VTWCLITQESMIYANWAPEILRYEKFREEYSMDGNLLFRGPRYGGMGEVGGKWEGAMRGGG
jgi:hypothetical protein